MVSATQKPPVAQSESCVHGVHSPPPVEVPPLVLVPPEEVVPPVLDDVEPPEDVVPPLVLVPPEEVVPPVLEELLPAVTGRSHVGESHARMRCTSVASSVASVGMVPSEMYVAMVVRDGYTASRVVNWPVWWWHRVQLVAKKLPA